MSEACADLSRFIRGEVDLGSFAHREHVRMGFEMLRRYTFDEAVYRYCEALRTSLSRAGKLAAFHQTITIAFLSVIAERMQLDVCADFSAFEQTNIDLMDKCALSRWYRPERLASESARRTFVLPDGAR